MSSRDCQRVLDALFGTDRDDDEVIYTGTSFHIPGLLEGRCVSRSAKALYTNQCTFTWPEGAPQERTDANVAWVYVVTLDDIEEKCPIPDLKPTVIVETSPGSYQYQYALTEPVTLEEGKALTERLKAREPALGDRGAMSANRLIKLPGGVNGKDTPEKKGFKTRLVDVFDVTYSVEELVAEWALPEVTARVNTGSVGSPLYTLEDYKRVRDPVTSWLVSSGMVVSDSDTTGWMQIQCAWSAAHTDGVTIAGYSPIGQGERPDFRGYNCFHEHCTDKSTKDFLTWVEEQGGPHATVFDPVATLVSRYLLLEYSSEVADTWASAGAPYPIMALGAFRAAHREFIIGQRGGKSYHGELWLEHRDTVRCRGRVYEPGMPSVVSRDVDSILCFNTYRPIEHKMNGVDGSGLLPIYLTHLAWLIPDVAECALFHQWVAKKLQEPRTRSYAMLLVADLLEGEAGSRYGTGRSVVGDILGKVWQSGVAKLELSDITGRGDSQSAYTDWADGSQLVVVEETKDAVADYKLDHASYEKLKMVIDTRPIPGVRVKPKYQRIYTTTLYCNFLFFSNHSDALQLPADDRRFCVLKCAKGLRTFDEYAELHAFADSPAALGALYHWYMGVDVSGFDHITPVMTEAKRDMCTQARNSFDEIWDLAMAALPGAICTKKQLLAACLLYADDDDLGMDKRVRGMVAARWKKLWEANRFTYGEKFLRPRAIKQLDAVRKACVDSDIAWLCEEISQNGPV